MNAISSRNGSKADVAALSRQRVTAPFLPLTPQVEVLTQDIHFFSWLATQLTHQQVVREQVVRNIATDTRRWTPRREGRAPSRHTYASDVLTATRKGLASTLPQAQRTFHNASVALPNASMTCRILRA